VATNELGHKLARDLAHATMTLSVYRGGNRLPWLPGATIDAWVPCARGEVATGVPYPHVYFVQTIGARSAESGSIHCPACRAELAARRGAVQVTTAPAVATAPPPAVSSDAAQPALPF
jgi:hypothetical protein